MTIIIVIKYLYIYIYTCVLYVEADKISKSAASRLKLDGSEQPAILQTSATTNTMASSRNAHTLNCCNWSVALDQIVTPQNTPIESTFRPKCVKWEFPKNQGHSYGLQIVGLSF